MPLYFSSLNSGSNGNCYYVGNHKEAVLIDAGIRSVELTLTTPGTFDRMPHLLAQYGEVVDLGVGTVTNPADLARAVDAGASYLVTPITSAALVQQATDAGVPIVCPVLRLPRHENPTDAGPMDPIAVNVEDADPDVIDAITSARA